MKTNSNSLGHLRRLHFLDCLVCPEHCLPPCCGCGCVHDLNLSCIPSPHVVEQSLYDDHCVNPPLTGKIREMRNRV